MAMIRQADLDTRPRQALVMNIENLRAQAERIMDQTRHAAAAVIAEAAATRERTLLGAAEEGRAKGHAEGVAQGLAEGRERGREQAHQEAAERLARLEASWTAALEDFIAAREAMLRECELRALDLAVLMGERVARRAIAVDPGAVLPQVAAVLELATRGARLTLCVNPQDEDLLRQALPALLAVDAKERHIAIVTDQGVPVGSCLARSDGGGALDATIDARLRAVVDEMLPGHGGRPVAGPTPEEAGPRGAAQ